MKRQNSLHSFELMVTVTMVTIIKGDIVKGLFDRQGFKPTPSIMQAKHRKRIWASKGKTRVQRNINKYNREYNKVKCSTKILHVGQLSLLRIWGKCINCTRTGGILEEELIPFTIGKRGKAIPWWNYKINERMVAGITLEGYSIQNYNDNAKSPPAETFKKLKS